MLMTKKFGQITTLVQGIKGNFFFFLDSKPFFEFTRTRILTFVSKRFVQNLSSFLI